MLVVNWSEYYVPRRKRLLNTFVIFRKENVRYMNTFITVSPHKHYMSVNVSWNLGRNKTRGLDFII